MNQQEIKKAITVLTCGGTIAYPTDTLFGLGADATNPIAVKKIYLLKQRPFDKPLSIALSSLEMATQYLKISPENQKILEKFLPGPYTFILPKKSTISDIVTAGGDTIGFRIPAHQNTLDLISQFGRPIITTSINQTGEPELIDIKNLTIPVDYIMPGHCLHNSPSTVVNLVTKTILRRGVDANKIDRYLAGR